MVPWRIPPAGQVVDGVVGAAVDDQEQVRDLQESWDYLEIELTERNYLTFQNINNDTCQCYSNAT